MVTASAFHPISVYIPCYNGEKYIEKCLDGLERQSLAPDEIIVVNDGSTDSSLEIVRRHPAVRVINHSENLGLAAARNSGFGAAKNLWVASLDADVEPHPDWLLTLAKLIDELPNASGFSGRLIETYISSPADRWRCIHIPQEWGTERVINPPFIFGCNNLFRRDHIIEAGGYAVQFRTNGEDVDISRKLYRQGRTLAYDPLPKAYHLRSDSLSSVLKVFWAYHRHPEALLDPPRTVITLVRFIFRNLLKRSVRKTCSDLMHARFGLFAISFLMIFDSMARETRTFIDYRRKTG